MAYPPNFWTPQVVPPQDGEPVNSATESRALSQLTARDAYLLAQIQNLNQTGGRVVKSGAPLDPAGVTPGQVVYWNDAIQAYSPALAAITFDSQGYLENNPSSFATGFVLTAAAGVGDVLLYGAVTPGVDLVGTSMEALLDYPAPAGSFVDNAYYLSRKVAGAITVEPSMPRVKLGYFSGSQIIFAPSYDGYPTGHMHYDFSLVAQPAASQNYAGTGFTVVTPGSGPAYAVVDYFNAGTSEPLPAVAIAIRQNANTAPFTSYTIELSMVAGALQAQIKVGSTVESSVDLATSGHWPAWGTWTTVTGTQVDIAFFRHDGVYTANDPQADWTSISGAKYIIKAPDDLSGWANANPYDLDLQSPDSLQFRFRYIQESNPQLASAWPPLPLNSCSLEYETLSLYTGAAILPTIRNLFWSPAGATSCPWPTTYTVGTQASFVNNPPQTLSFIGTSPSSYDQLVTTLKSASPAILVQKCPDGTPASTGNLQLSLDLGLNVGTTVGSGFDTSFASVTGEVFTLAPTVSELVAGSGIALTRLDAGSPNALVPTKNSGLVQVSLLNLDMEGEFSDIALRNAKEIFRDNLAYIGFIQPSVSPSAISAKFKVPQASVVAANTSLTLNALFLGTAAVASSVSNTAVFQAVYQIIRPGFNLNSITDANAIAVQYWVVTFNGPYTALTIQDAEAVAMDVGTGGSSTAALPVTYSDIVTHTGLSPSLVIGTPQVGFTDNDIVTVRLSRVSQTPSAGVLDTYAGDVGLVSLRYQLQTVS